VRPGAASDIAPPFATMMFAVGPMRTSNVSVPGVVTMFETRPFAMMRNFFPIRIQFGGSDSFAVAWSIDVAVVLAVSAVPSTF
jgi:hypothetical protein